MSALGSSFTAFAVPLLVFELTGSPFDLGLAAAATYLPYPIVGLLIGAYVDRLDRRRLMIAADLVRATTIATIAAASAVGEVSIALIVSMAVVASVATIAFDAAETAAVASLVPRDQLVQANGRLQASYSAAQVAGPLLAGVVVTLLPLEVVLALDAASFLVSAGLLATVRTSFGGRRRARPGVLEDIVEGLRFTLGNPVLRNLAVLVAIVNFLGRTVATQLVLFASLQLAAGRAEIAVLLSAGSVGVIVFSLGAARLRRRTSFARATLGPIVLAGVLIAALANTSSIAAAGVLWAGIMGLVGFFNVNSQTLRQTIVAPEMLGRATTVSRVLSWSAIPLGTLLGGWTIERTDDVVLVVTVIGALVTLTGLAFRFSALGRADRLAAAYPAPT